MKPIYKKYIKMVTLTWSACFVLLFVVHMILLAPQLKIKKQLKAQLAEKEQIFNDAQATTSEQAKAALNEEIKGLRDTLYNFTVDHSDSSNSTFAISQIAKEKKVTSLSSKTKSNLKIPNSDFLTKNQINISFNSGFEQFAVFLNSLERNNPVIFVDQFTITRSQDGNWNHNIKMNLSVLVTKRRDG